MKKSFWDTGLQTLFVLSLASISLSFTLSHHVNDVSSTGISEQDKKH